MGVGSLVRFEDGKKRYPGREMIKDVAVMIVSGEIV